MTKRNKPKLLIDMDRYIGEKGSECMFVPYPVRDPRYESMDGKQLAYYLHWRTELFKGRMLKSDSGYKRLLLSEIKCRRHNDRRSADALKILQETMGGEEERDMFMFATVRLLELKVPLTFIKYEDDYSCDLTVCDAMSRLPEPLPSDVIDVLSGREPGKGRYTDRIRKVFSRALSHFIDSVGKERFLSVFSTGKQYIDAEWSRTFAPRTHLPDSYNAIEYDQILLENATTSLCRGILECCEAMAGTPVRDTDSEHRKLIRSVIRGTDDDPEGGYTSIRVLDTREEDAPVCFQPTSMSAIAKMMRNPHGRPPVPDSFRGYVPSVDERGINGDVERIPYYRIWKQNLRNGKCMTTDNGYVWALVREALTDMDPQEVMDILPVVAEGYDAVGAWIDDILGEYMALRGIRPKKLTGGMRHLRICMALDSICEDPEATATPDGIRMAFDPDWRDSLDIDERTAKLICDGLRDSCIEAGGKDRFYRKLNLKKVDLGEEIPGLDPRWNGKGRSRIQVNDWMDLGDGDYLRDLAHGILERDRKSKDAGKPPEETAAPAPEPEGENERRWHRTFRRPEGPAPEFVPGPWNATDRRTMSERQRRYYLHWRAWTVDGIMKKGDPGYARLLLGDLIDSDIEWNELSGILGRLRTDFPGMIDTIDRFACDWCLVHDRDMDRIPDWGLSWSCVQDVLAHPIGNIPEYTVRRILTLNGIPQKYDIRLMARNLVKVDRALHSMTGRGISDTYLRDNEILEHTAFSGYGKEKEVGMRVTSPVNRSDLSKLILWIANGCSGKASGVPRLPPKIKESFLIPAGTWEGPREGTCTKMRADDPRAARNVMNPRKLPGSYQGPVLQIPPWEMKVEPRGYVPGKDDFLSTDNTTSGMRSYYAYWRNNINSGSFGETDTSYMVMLLADLIINIRYEDGVMTILESLQDVYGKDDEDGLISRTAISYAKLNGLDAERFGYIERDDYGRMVRLMLDGEEAEISAEGMRRMLSYEGQPDGMKLAMMNAMILSFAMICGGETTALEAGLGLRIRKTEERSPRELEPYGLSWTIPTAEVEVLDGSPLWGLTKGSGRKRRSPGKEVPKQEPPRKVEITLDMDAVRTAQDDLDSVTELMATTDSEDLPTAETVISEKGDAADDPWTAFISSLDPEETDHLRSILSGKGRNDVRLEDSINAKAMDSTGDTVIEGGEPIEDYRDSILSVLGTVPDGPEDEETEEPTTVETDETPKEPVKVAKASKPARKKSETKASKNECKKLNAQFTDDEYTNLLYSLRNEEREYVRKLVKGPKPRGRRPLRLIESINARSQRHIGRDIITKDGLDPEFAEFVIDNL